MEISHFDKETAPFLAWLSQMGIQVNAKIGLVDLRAEKKGRGVGRFPNSLDIVDSLPVYSSATFSGTIRFRGFVIIC